MEFIPDDAIQVHIHSLTIARTDTLLPHGTAVSSYIPILLMSYIRKGEVCSKRNPFYTTGGLLKQKALLSFPRRDDVLKSLEDIIAAWLKKDVIVLLEPVFGEISDIKYGDEQVGRIFHQSEVRPLYSLAELNPRTFADIWAETLQEFSIFFQDEDGNTVAKRWMKDEDDLIGFMKRMIDEGNIFLDMQNVFNALSIYPKIGYRDSRKMVESYFVISYIHPDLNRKTYFTACNGVDDDGENGTMVYSSTIRGAYPFISEDAALNFALWTTNSCCYDAFEIEELIGRRLLCQNDWMSRLEH